MAGFFIDPAHLPRTFFGDVQLLELFLAYAYLLYCGCTLISDGAELLMLTPYAKLVGAVILPVLGAVPDGAIVLFSGLGSDAQKSLDVGVGALAGSTVMLITVPWALAIYGGRVNLDPETKEPKYAVPRGQSRLFPPDNLWNAGVTVGDGGYKVVLRAALWMLATATPYFVVEIAALVAESDHGGVLHQQDVDDDQAKKMSMQESPAVLLALLLTFGAFLSYLAYQYRQAYYVSSSDAQLAQARLHSLQVEATVNAVKNSSYGLVAAVRPVLAARGDAQILRARRPSSLGLGGILTTQGSSSSSSSSQTTTSPPMGPAAASSGGPTADEPPDDETPYSCLSSGPTPAPEAAPLVPRAGSSSEAEADVDAALQRVLWPFFRRYDVDDSRTLEVSELGRVFDDMNEPKTAGELDELFKEYDVDKSGTLSFAEFCDGMKKYVRSKPLDVSARGATVQRSGSPSPGSAAGSAGNGTTTSGAAGVQAVAAGESPPLVLPTGPVEVVEEDEEEEEVPEEFAEDKFKSVEEQQAAIQRSALKQCLLGTALVLAFSDPITDVLDEVGARTGINAFYVGFVVAPLITNGSELLASYTFALKKTSKSMVVAYEQLLGAAIMNNTFALAIFLVLIYAQSLYWNYTSEVIAILCAELVVFVIVTSFKVHTLKTACAVLALYPLTILLVWCLENLAGLS